MYKLSIIIPYYNTYELTKELLEILMQQITDDVEVIVVDDGCGELRIDELIKDYNQMVCIHSMPNSHGASIPRNIGIDHAKGNYIAFIDSDDMVSDDYIPRILKAIETKPDIVYLSWETEKTKFIMTTKPYNWNCAVWCRVYKKEIIGSVRFDPKLRTAEDWDFNSKIKPKVSVCIKEPIYKYNQGRKGSLTNG